MNTVTKRGRPVSPKTAELRNRVLKVINTLPNGTSLSTIEVARSTKQSKVRVVHALRFHENQGNVKRVGSLPPKGHAGRPEIVWGQP